MYCWFSSAVKCKASLGNCCKFYLTMRSTEYIEAHTNEKRQSGTRLSSALIWCQNILLAPFPCCFPIIHPPFSLLSPIIFREGHHTQWLFQECKDLCFVQAYFSKPCQLCPALATVSALSSKWLLVFSLHSLAVQPCLKGTC